jgi:outer membrane protein TolC
MREQVFTLICLVSSMSQAAAGATNFQDFLSQVQSKNPDYLALTKRVESLELRAQESRLLISPEAFADYSYIDDQTQPTNPFSPTRIHNEGFSVGLRSQTQIGLAGELAFGSRQISLAGVSPNFVDFLNANNTFLNLTLTQPLWRNSFGSATRRQVRLKESSVNLELSQAQFQKRQFLLTAENIYWTVAALREVIDLQNENVSVARRTAQTMGQKVRQRLADDVDGLQTQAALQAREIELQQSKDSYQLALRQLNRMRGFDPKAPFEPAELPYQQWLKELGSYSGRTGHREDFQALKQQAHLTELQGELSKDSLRPDVSLYGRATMNGREPGFNGSFEEMQGNHFPRYEVGVRLTAPLNFGVASDVKSGFSQQAVAGRLQSAAASDLEKRTWTDSLERAQESAQLFERSQKLEAVQKGLIEKERRRLQNGRSTIFQVLQAEQNFAQAQIQRVRATLQMIQGVLDLRGYNTEPNTNEATREERSQK